LCLARTPDVIITDAYLDGLSGVDAIAAIRQRLAVGVVFVTGRLHEDEAVGQGAGAVVLAKPFTIEQLRPAVEAALRQLMEQNGAPSRSARRHPSAGPELIGQPERATRETRYAIRVVVSSHHSCVPLTSDF
jgi:DNA-binding response OmpR family regulator